MSRAIILLDKYKKCRSLASDNACATSLGISRATISGWRHGAGRPNVAQIDALCAGCGEDSAHWIPLIESERATSETERRVWRKIAERFGATMATMVLFLAPITNEAAASTVAPKTSQNQSTVYIMSAFRRWSVRGFARLKQLCRFEREK